MGDIAPQAIVWGGSPRSASPQYIQDAIDAGSPGDTYTLLEGEHRGQQFTTQLGDIFVIGAGAVLNGTENVGTDGWTNHGGGIWSKAIVSGERWDGPQNSGCAPGWDCYNLEVMIFDGQLYGWYETLGQVDEFGCYYDGAGTVYIGLDPLSFDVIEIARAEYINGTAAELRGASLAERAEIYGYASESGQAEGAISMSAPGTIIRDLDVHACAGGAIGFWNYAYMRNVTVRENGQIGVYVNQPPHTDYVTVGEGCYFYHNGVGGWSLGNEGGNSKFAGSERVTIKGTLWDLALYDDGRFGGDYAPAAFWFDINNDGYRIHSNVVRDPIHAAGRGMFIEISYSGKIWDNIMYELAWGAEDPFWGKGLMFSSTGAQPPETIDDTIEVWGNLLYKCNGGIGGVQNRFGWQQTYAKYDPSSCKHWRIHNNTTYYDGTQPSADWTGVVDATDDPTVPVFDNEWEDNLYLVPSAGTEFIDDQDGGAGGDLTWAQWNAAGHDDQEGLYLVGSDYNPDPFNGGAM